MLDQAYVDGGTGEEGTEKERDPCNQMNHGASLDKIWP